MINIKSIFCVVFFVTVLTACEEQTELLDKEKYVFEIPQVDLTVDARIGAYYYQYDAGDWAEPLAYTPMLGEYDPLSPTVLDQQISWAESGGIDFFVFKWNGSGDDGMLTTFQTQAADNNLKMVIGYNTAHLNATNSSPLVDAKLATMLDEFTTLAEDHLKQGHYYSIDGRPVILITPLNLPSSRANSIDYPMVVSVLRSAMQGIGLDPYVIGELTTGWTAPVNFDESTLAAMDGIVLTTWNTDDWDRAWAFHSYADLNYGNWNTSLGALNVDYVPSIFPGFHDADDEDEYVIERSEKNYVSYCNIAKRSMGENLLILVNSWNDFQKGTTLEPTVEYNTDYLSITKREFKVE